MLHNHGAACHWMENGWVTAKSSSAGCTQRGSSNDHGREAINAEGWLSMWKSSHVIRSADSNSNKAINKSEVNSLVDFAHDQLRIKMVACCLF